MDRRLDFPLPAVLGGDSSYMDSNGVSTALARADARVRMESNIVSLLKSVSSSSPEVQSRGSVSELAIVEDLSCSGALRSCDIAVELVELPEGWLGLAGTW